MTTVAYCAVAPDGRTAPDQILWTDEAMPGLRVLTDAVHAEGAAISAQIGHAGPVADPRGNGLPALSPSTRFPNMSGSESRARRRADIERITAAHADAAPGPIEAGFDAVEVHLGHSYLASAFLSPKINHRTDEYGGSLDNRAKVGRGILRAVRDVVGNRHRDPHQAEHVRRRTRWDHPRRGDPDRPVDRGRMAPSTRFEMTAGSSLLNPMYLFKGGAPVEEFVERDATADEDGDAVRRPAVHPRVPLLRRLPARGRPQGAGGAQPADGAARRDHRPGVDGPRDAEGFEFVAMGRALLREPDLVNRIAADAATPRCASTATGACRPTSSAPTAR